MMRLSDDHPRGAPVEESPRGHRTERAPRHTVAFIAQENPVTTFPQPSSRKPSHERACIRAGGGRTSGRHPRELSGSRRSRPPPDVADHMQMQCTVGRLHGQGLHNPPPHRRHHTTTSAGNHKHNSNSLKSQCTATMLQIWSSHQACLVGRQQLEDPGEIGVLRRHLVPFHKRPARLLHRRVEHRLSRRDRGQRSWCVRNDRT